MPMSAPDRQRAARSDGEQSREKLLHAGLRMLAAQGFSKTSTHEIAEAANTPVAAMSADAMLDAEAKRRTQKGAQTTNGPRNIVRLLRTASR